jgi:hypothetical protein
MEVLKKLITTELKRSFSAGYRLNDGWREDLAQMLGMVKDAHNFSQELSENPNQLLVHELAALQTWIFEPLDLLLDNVLKCRGAHEERRCGALQIRSEMNDAATMLIRTDELYRITLISPSFT